VQTLAVDVGARRAVLYRVTDYLRDVNYEMEPGYFVTVFVHQILPLLIGGTMQLYCKVPLSHKM